MISHILYDLDGVVVNSPKRLFSTALAERFGASHDRDLLPFFEGVFQHCLIGKADLKEVLPAYLPRWRWRGNVEELLRFWFENERAFDERMLSHIKELRGKGKRCFLATNNEKYRTKYLWKEMFLCERFDDIFSSASVGFLKSEQEFWEAVFARMGNPDKESVFFWDDDQQNVDAARQFGFAAEFYTDFDTYKNKMRQVTSSQFPPI